MENVLTSEHIDEFWNRMAQMYGHRWTSAYGDRDEGGTWLACLRGLTPETVSHGVGECLRQSYRWPPTVVEFRELCLDVPTFAEYHDEEMSSGYGYETCEQLERRCRREYPAYCERYREGRFRAIAHDHKLKLVSHDE